MKKLLLIFLLVCLCNYVQTKTLMSEGFNGATTPAGWSVVDVLGTAGEITFETISSVPYGYTPTEGTRMVVFNSFFACFGNNVRLSKTVPFSTSSYRNIKVNFDWLQDNYVSSKDRVYIQWSTDGTTWSSSDSALRYSTATGWTSKSFTLPAGANNQANLYIGFLFISECGYNCHLDNLIVTADTLVDKDLSVTKWVLPENYTDKNSTQIIKVEVANFGIDDITNFDISYSVDSGSTFVLQNIPGTIVSGDTNVYTFSTTADMGLYKKYYCRAAVNFAGDKITKNDTLKTVIRKVPAPVISGNIQVPGIVLNYVDGIAKTVTSDGSGNYSFVVPHGWSGTVTPSSADYIFWPQNISYTNIRLDSANQNFSAVSIVPVLTITRTTTPPKIDGVSDTNDPWGSIAWTNMTANKGITFDMTAKFKLAYDDDNLYLITRIEGNNTTDTSSASIPNTWENDCLEVFLKMNITSNPDGSYDPDGTYSFRQRRASIYPDRFDNYPGSKFKSDPNFRNAQVNEPTAYTQEWRFPWATLVGTTNWDKKTFKMELQSSDNTTGSLGGRTQQLFWRNNSDNEYFDTRTFSVIHLQDKVKPIISGNTGTGNVVLKYFDGVEKTDTSDASGNYSFSVSTNWSGTVTPSKFETGFVPEKMTYSNVLADQLSQDYITYSTAPALVIKKAGNQPKIDGEVDINDPWQKTDWVNMTAEWPGNSTNGMSSKFKLMYDDNNLYLVVKTEGNVTTDTSSASIPNTWESDCIEVYVKMDTSSYPTGNYESDGTFQFRMRRASEFPDRFDAWNHFADMPQRFYLNNNFKLKQTNGSSDFIQEWQMPWDSLKGNINWDKKAFKFEIKSADNTTGTSGGRTQQVFWRNNQDIAWNDTRAFSYIKLEQPVGAIIKGNAGIPGAIICYTDGTPKTYTCDGSGNFFIQVTYNWTGSLTPSKLGYSFIPSSRNYSNLIADSVNQNFVASNIGTVTISGNSGAAGANLKYVEGIEKSVVSNSSGDYSFDVTYNWSGTVTPSLVGYTFSPASRTYNNTIVNQTAQNYTGTFIGTSIISGNTEISGVTLSYTEITPKSTLSDGSGNYSITVSSGWTGTVTPSKTGYEFTPVDRSYTNLSTNKSAQNFDAITLKYLISGNVGLSGVTLSYTDTTAKTVTSDISGNYSIEVSYNWSGTITPSKTNVSFAPASRSYTEVLSNKTGQNFVGSLSSPLLSILKTSTPPLIDGEVDANDPWDMTPWVNMTAQRSGNSTSGMSAKFKLLYDDSNLYLVAMQENNTTTDTSSASIPNTWENDCMEIYVKIDTTCNPSGVYEPDGTYQFRMRRASVYPDRFDPPSSHASRFLSDPDFNIAQVNENTFFTQEWQLPWDSLKGSISWDKKYFKFEIQASDNTTGSLGGRTQQTFWRNNSDNEWNDTRTFSLVKLEPSAPKISGNTGEPGVTLSYTDGGAKTVVSDGSGNYSITVSIGWSGTVTPSKTGFTFSPTSYNYVNLTSDNTSKDYTPTSIGTVTISGNAGSQGVTLSYTDGSVKTVTSDVSGNYTITVSKNWSGTVTPAKACIAFSPDSRTYSSISADQLSQDFTGTAATYTISGNVGVQDVVFNYTDGTNKTVTSDASGNYSFTVSCGWSGTITPLLDCYDFNPGSKTYNNITANKNSQDYTSTALTYTISGNAGVAGAVLSYTDGTNKSVTADAFGNYSLAVSCGWTGSITPAKACYSFSPVSKNYSGIASNQNLQNFTADNSISISGNAGLAGVVLSYTDGTAKTVTTDVSGNYSFTVSCGWTGTVSASKNCYTFSPADISYNALNISKVAQNYSAIPNKYTITGSTGIAGAIISFTDTTAKTVTADGSGNYSLIVSCEWSGTITPSKNCYTFSPASKSFSNVAANQTAQNFNANANKYTITGTSGIAGAVISFTDTTAKTVTADASGNYSLTVSCGWSGTITPSKNCYTFSPASKSFTTLAANQTAQNFTATANKYTITGSSGIAGAIFSFTDTTAKTVTADASGNYSLTVSCDWSGTITPSKSCYTFSPANKSYTSIAANQTAQNYTATALTYTIAGNTGIAGVTLSYTDGTAKTVTADASGNYTLTVPCGWAGTVTPSKSCYSFTPANKSYTSLAANQTAQNYTATALTYTITGNTGIPAVTLSYTDGTAKTATADASGNYSVTVSCGWTGTITPSKNCYSFSPASKSYTSVSVNQATQNFTATANKYTISGSTGMAGVVLSFTDTTAKTVNTDASGNYTLTVSCGWTGTVTPSKNCITFSPSSKSYTSLAANQTQNFTGSVNKYTISGNTGIPGVLISFTDTTAKTITSDASGNYSLTVSCGWTGTITPSKDCNSFSPASKSYTALAANQSAQNYTATHVTYDISGIAGIAGVTITYTDTTEKTVVTDASGNFSLKIPCGWTGTFTPSKAGFTFTPSNVTVTEPVHLPGTFNFTGTLLTVIISGNAGVAGAILQYKEGTDKTVTADASGNYSISVVYNWTGTVTPTKPNYIFTPVSRSYSNANINYTNQNYSATSTSILLTKSLEFEVYPVPTSDVLNISYESTESKILKFNIINIAGQVVYSQDLNVVSGNNLKQIDIKSFEKGTYYVRLVSGKQMNIKTIIIK